MMLKLMMNSERCAGPYTEALKIEYDPAVITYDELLTAFWEEHNPSGRKPGPQYKSAGPHAFARVPSSAQIGNRLRGIKLWVTQQLKLSCGGHGESMVPPHTLGSVSLFLTN
jgi:hypothetical protein